MCAPPLVSYVAIAILPTSTADAMWLQQKERSKGGKTRPDPTHTKLCRACKHPTHEGRTPSISMYTIDTSDASCLVGLPGRRPSAGLSLCRSQYTGLGREYHPPFCGTLSLSAKIGTVRRLRAHEMRAVKAHSVTCLEF